MTDIVAVRVVGGLGNQMFQYAAGRALAARLGADLRLDIAGYRRYPLHGFALDRLPIRAQIDMSKPGVLARLPRRLLRWTGLGAALGLYCERSLRFDPEVLHLPAGSCLDGYWQSDRYFIDHEHLIRQELTPSGPVDADNQRMLDSIRSGTSISLHIRRGDYVSNPKAQAVHGTCDLGYYERALTYLAERCPADTRLFAFSDDPDWVISNLRTSMSLTVVRHNGPERNTEDLRLMSACTHHVIANSSFSWWGAWLNPRSDKIVVAPAKWFQAPNLDATDLVPADWVRL